LPVRAVLKKKKEVAKREELGKKREMLAAAEHYKGGEEERLFAGWKSYSRFDKLSIKEEEKEGEYVR